ncbi:Co2+/Mg2+ efflux protein ApaG [Aliidiomarina sanyensis]|uniref:Protein ApaG n=1 Tax=Aliidiomarina sanyensis TaxID=1249555 RepID=A0A432WCN1_9GAMM|nr:Co2+/Mg2+ efflux protein ApaG [Aliidiomarina sanyensis]RUO30164.1 Co2+/Mg2+ efflux protein ApaG [Aliidiomarina sanyensis]
MSRTDVALDVETQYLTDQSEPDQEQFVFSYTITISNKGDQPVQLLSRKWIITDANGKVTEVMGEGVVGKQPRIEPGKTFKYTSGTVLKTPLGLMEGSYAMVNEDGTKWQLSIPVFRLAKPNILH